MFEGQYSPSPSRSFAETYPSGTTCAGALWPLPWCLASSPTIRPFNGDGGTSAKRLKLILTSLQYFCSIPNAGFGIGSWMGAFLSPGMCPGHGKGPWDGLGDNVMLVLKRMLRQGTIERCFENTTIPWRCSAC